MNKILIAIFLASLCSSFILKKESKFLTLSTVIFTVKYPESLIPNSNLTIRGDACNLTWNKGAKINKNGEDTWMTSFLCEDNKKVSVKVLLNDTVWMMGANQIFTSKNGLTV